jgi:hypothetical protein
MRADAECKRRFRKSGTTATLAVVCGWELLVASVGDSCAYLDTGREVMMVSANHRIDDNAEEQARIIAAGGGLGRRGVFCLPVWGCAHQLLLPRRFAVCTVRSSCGPRQCPSLSKAVP